MKLKQLYKNIPEKKIRIFLFYAVSFVFVFLNAWLVIKKETLLGGIVPVLLVILLTAIFSYDKLIWLTVFLTPLSIPLDELSKELSFDMNIPTEPLLFGILLLFFISLARGNKLGKKILRHPVAIIIYFYLGWMILTSVTSTLPVVSFKYLLSHIWYISIFFFLLTYLFKEQKYILKFIWLYVVAFVPVIVYTIVRHLKYGLYDDQVAHWVMSPFFNDHTSYGAALAMYIPFLLGFSVANWIPWKHKIWIWGLLTFFILAEVLSYSRAAWLSLIVAFVVWVIIKLKIKFRTLFITLMSIVVIMFAFQEQILQKIEKNSTESSANLMNHITSMANISTDASNLERINRWHCAITMFKEKPVLGWGPGTYAMNYAPYQLTDQRTIISTNYGDGGNAHSEYLGALAESGLLGMLNFMILVIMVLYTGIRAYSRTDDKRIKMILLASITSLVTYYTHSFLNNFLDTDKASVPFWGFAAIIVALDIYTREQKNNAPLHKHLEQ